MNEVSGQAFTEFSRDEIRLFILANMTDTQMERALSKATTMNPTFKNNQKVLKKAPEKYRAWMAQHVERAYNRKEANAVEAVENAMKMAAAAEKEAEVEKEEAEERDAVSQMMAAEEIPAQEEVVQESLTQEEAGKEVPVEEAPAEEAAALSKRAQKKAQREEKKKKEQLLKEAKKNRKEQEKLRKAAERAAAEEKLAAEKAAKEKAAEERARKAAEKAAADRAAAEQAIAERAARVSAAAERIEADRTAPEKKAVEKPLEKERLLVGYINIRNSYYNLNPFAELKDGKIVQFTKGELEDIIPGSMLPNINLSYNYNEESTTEYMSSHFYDGMLAVYRLEKSDLIENIQPNGSINNTRYKILQTVWKHKLEPLSRRGYYPLRPKEILVEGIAALEKKTVRVAIENIVDGEKFFINLGGFYAGPYEIKHSLTGGYDYIRSDAAEKGYLVSGYESGDCWREDLISNLNPMEYTDRSWTVYDIKDNAHEAYRDIITNERLIQSLGSSIKEITDDAAGEERLMSSPLLIGDFPEAVKKERIERLKKLIFSFREEEASSSDILSAVSDLIFNHPEEPQARSIIAYLLTQSKDMKDAAKLAASEVRIDAQQQSQEELASLREELRKTRQMYTEAEARHWERLGRIGDIKRLDETYDLLHDYDSAVRRKNELEDSVQRLERHMQTLSNEAGAFEAGVEAVFKRTTDRLSSIVLDDFLSNKMMEAASGWNRSKEAERLTAVKELVGSVAPGKKTGEALVDHLVKTINIARPTYDRNLIINIMTCIVQGFITVFSGQPGCGKTSICNITGRALGLDRFDKELEMSGANRYIAVSCERGWSSKRDLIGYYNPLTKRFEESNHQVFDALRILDLEYKDRKGSRYPMMILLDEANLSPIEYYWADFMNCCDSPEDRFINMGDSNIFRIPDTLRFVATINNDHTTETLSPRLIDRAWIVTLPQNTGRGSGRAILTKDIEHIGWDELRETFSAGSEVDMELEAQQIYDQLKKLLERFENAVNVSARADIAIRRYCSAAARYMVDDEFGNSPAVAALDYAISQRILPKISGSGEDYETFLSSLVNFCSEHNLMRSADILTEIINRGNRQMQYYQFFR